MTRGVRFILRERVGAGASGTVVDFLSQVSGLSKAKLKRAMSAGAVWRRDVRGALKRHRRATSAVRAGDVLELYYDESVLSLDPPAAQCVADFTHYSVWFKPVGLMSQGTRYGDHCAIVRQVEAYFGQPRKVFLVHRLDREAEGIMLIAHSRRAAAALSDLFRRNLVSKTYRAELLGNLLGRGRQGSIEIPLDGKPSRTDYEVISYSEERNVTTVSVRIVTGRLHQIRRHFDMIGHPVMGDPRYGRGNKNTDGMKLSALSLRFFCPFQNRNVEFLSPRHP